MFLTQCLLNLALNNNYVLKNSTASNLTPEPNYSAVEIKINSKIKWRCIQLFKEWIRQQLSKQVMGQK